MTSQWVSRFNRFVFPALGAALLSANVAAQMSEVSVLPVNTGPISVSDLNVLLGDDMQFQVFEFEAKEKFCLVLGYLHKINGQRAKRRPYNDVVCNLAGRQRLIIAARWTGGQRRLLFGLHHIDTGSGAIRTTADLPIGKEVGSAVTFRQGGTIHPGKEFTLLRWRFGNDPHHPGPRHELSIIVRLDENDGSISSTSKPNDFSQ